MKTPPFTWNTASVYPKQSSKPPQIEIWNTIIQRKILECHAPAQTVSHLLKNFWRRFCTAVSQGRNEVRWRPGQEASLALPCSNLRSSGSKYIGMKQIIVKLLGLFGAPSRHLASPAVIRRPHNDPVPGELCPLPPRLYTPDCSHRFSFKIG